MSEEATINPSDLNKKLSDSEEDPKDQRIKQLNRIIEGMKVRESSLKCMLLGVILLEVGEFLANRITDKILLLIFPITCAILVLYGLYNFFSVEHDISDLEEQ